MFVTYPALFLKEKESECYTVTFPDLQGCVTSGDDVYDALEMAQDVLGAYLFEYYNKPNEMPNSSKIEDVEIKIDDDDLEYFQYNSSFKNYVTLDLSEYVRKTSVKIVEKTLTIPSYLNQAWIENNINFSLVLQEALKKELQIK